MNERQRRMRRMHESGTPIAAIARFFGATEQRVAILVGEPSALAALLDRIRAVGLTYEALHDLSGVRSSTIQHGLSGRRPLATENYDAIDAALTAQEDKMAEATA